MILGERIRGDVSMRGKRPWFATPLVLPERDTAEIAQ
jgi:hypothetical protein